MPDRLPPTVEIDAHAPVMSAYLRGRLAQHMQDFYMGVPVAKFPEDLRVYEHLLWLDAPDTVVELGTHHGGSALWFRDRLDALARHGRISREPHVVSVDIDQSPARGSLAGRDLSGLSLVEGDLADARVVARVADAVGNGRCLVVEDTAHTYASTSAALRSYARFVPAGGFMVIEDGVVDDPVLRFDDWPRGVRPAVEEWLGTQAGRAFTVRRDLELYGVTCHPRGFLQRSGE
jgi:cephalosporin hydroxylase